MNKLCLVVPCFNEEKRLSLDTFKEFSDHHAIDICFVNDGSTDDTSNFLKKIASEKIEVYDLDENRGKAEAVRRGMERAFEKGYEIVGFWDADLATPLDEVEVFLEKIEEGHSVVMGSRILRMGGKIKRKWYRHYLGRFFATAASLILDLPVYDTQCGAKLFTKECSHAFKHEFLSKWLFDVELLLRLKVRGMKMKQFYEVPLRNWEDAHGSKLKLKDFLIAPLELLRMHFKYN